MVAETPRDRMEILVSAVMTAIFAISVAVAASYPPPTCVMPLLVGVAGLALSIYRLWSALRTRVVPERAVSGAPDFYALAWVLTFGAASVVFGFMVAGPALVAAYVRARSGMGMLVAAMAALAAFMVLYGGFESLLGFPLFRGLVWELRS